MNVGARVSIRAVDSLLPPGLTQKNAIVGVVARREPESVYLQITSNDTLRLPRATITRLDVSHGKSRRRSAIRLGVLEAAVMAMLPPPPRGEYYDSDHIRGIAIGAALGGLIGAIWPAEEWKRLRP